MLPIAMITALAVAFVCAGFALWYRRSYKRVSRELQFAKAFSQDTTHEIATVVSALKSRLLLLERNCSGESETDLKALSQAVERLSALSQDLRLLARTDGAKGLSRLAFIRLDRMAAETVEELKPAASLRGMSLEIEPPAPTTIVGDSEGVKRVIANLLSNSIKYGTESGAVRVRVEQDAQFASVVVCDDGPGIPEADLGYIFERFYCGETGDQHGKGSGLGLAIVKAVVDAHAGDITVKSSPERGTEFIVRLRKVSKQQWLPSILEKLTT